MDRTHMIKLLTDAAAEVMDVDREQITPDARFVEDLDGDSLGVLEVFEVLQEKLRIPLPIEAFDGVATVSQAADVALRIVAEGAESAT